MPTSVHLPRPLLDELDRRARALRVSRNSLIVRALERDLRQGSDWSPGFLERLATIDPATAAAVDELLVQVRTARKSKAPVSL